MTVFDATVDPEGATAMAADVVAQAAADINNPPQAPDLPDYEVKLPGGYYSPLEGVYARTATVRELDGEDEEAIGRHANNLSRYFDTILARGVSYVGDVEASTSILDRMLQGDRDAMLIGIRRVTFGDIIEYRMTCPACSEKQEQEISITDDIPMDTLDDVRSEATWEMKLASGKVVKVSLPDGACGKAMAAAEERNEAVLNSILLAKTVSEIDGAPVVGEFPVRKGLSIRDRREIITEIVRRNPGPRWSEVSRPCVSCGESISVPMNLVDLFLL